MHLLKGLSVKRGLDVPEIGCWSRVIEAEHNMSFQKLCKSPTKHGAIIVRDTRIFLGSDDEFSHLSMYNAIDQQNEWFSSNCKKCSIELPTMFAVMEFVQNDCTNKNLKKYANYREQGCKESGNTIKVIPVTGECSHIRTNIRKGYKQGDSVEIQNCEYYVKDHMALAKKEGYNGIWIVASQMCQRSFTIGKIYITMLSYDKGSAGGTAQRTSRISSPAHGKDAGLIVSNSFDATRDEKIDSMLSNRAKSRANRTGESFMEAGRSVKRGFSIFTLDNNGDQIQLEWDEYTYRLATQQNGLSNSLARELLKKVIDNGLEERFMQATRKSISNKGKDLDDTFVDPKLAEQNRKNRSNPSKEISIEVILKALKYITENMDIVHRMATHDSKKCILECVKEIDSNSKLVEEFFSQFNIEPSYLIDILENDIHLQELTNQLISVKLYTRVKERRQSVKDYFDGQVS